MTANEFDSLHKRIIEILTEGRATPAYLAERTDESSQLMNNRLRDLIMAGYVTKIHTGLYEINLPDDTDITIDEWLEDND
jgi:predicted HTH transcriptional regulator